MDKAANPSLLEPSFPAGGPRTDPFSINREIIRLLDESENGLDAAQELYAPFDADAGQILADAPRARERISAAERNLKSISLFGRERLTAQSLGAEVRARLAALFRDVRDFNVFFGLLPGVDAPAAEDLGLGGEELSGSAIVPRGPAA